jgi:hypothetical protein
MQITETSSQFVDHGIRVGDVVYILSEPWYKKFYRWLMNFIGGYPKYSFKVTSVDSDTSMTIEAPCK